MKWIKKIDHIGIAVPDMEEAVETYRKLLFREPSFSEFIEATGMEIVFFDVGGVLVELLASKMPGNELEAFLREKGGGLHHICYEVDDIDKTLERLKADNVKLIDESPREGSRNSRIVFIDPQGADGVLTEYCELARA